MVNKLPTLRDLEVEDMSDKIVMSHKLREQAIKEIVLLKQEGEKSHGLGLYKFDNDFFLHDKYNHSEFFLLIRYIKWKFNITDEDINKCVIVSNKENHSQEKKLESLSPKSKGVDDLVASHPVMRKSCISPSANLDGSLDVKVSDSEVKNGSW